MRCPHCGEAVKASTGKPKLSPKQRKEFDQLAREGMTGYQLAERFKLSKTRAYYLRRKALEG